MKITNNANDNSCALCVFWVAANHYERFLHNISFISTNFVRETLYHLFFTGVQTKSEWISVSYPDSHGY